MNLQLPTKPAMTYTDCYRLVFVFSHFIFNVLHIFVSPCVRVGKLFCRFWFLRWLVRPANVLDYEALAIHHHLFLLISIYLLCHYHYFNK